LKKRIAKITGTFHLNALRFLFFFIALAFMDGHYIIIAMYGNMPYDMNK
jgi:hypothetical protein